ncbi:MAG: acetylglucosaminyldiphospho-UDP acetyl-beta-D-mannosaminyltransferase [Parcubacteria group bacterium]|nr:acetylglucosaminyldiphospho-UDP acetyl-beta-D-mannosaminyltransferase [Parcubacteria group bacterium]|tara:strand:+ start:5789 stop:6565 length:777 start_codon:yes stop_codon:yes gene_type:complete
MAKVDILGVQIDNLSLQEVLENIKQFLNSRNQHFIVTPNPEFLVAANKDQNFKQILNYADIAVADGIGLIKAAKFLGKRLQRVTGVDLVWAISELAAEKKYPIYFLGADEMIAAQTAEFLKQEFNKLKIAGAESGGEIINPQTPDQDLIKRIQEARPKILFVAFGQVKQEKWIFANLDKFPSVKLAVGVGGAFDYISGEVSRAPKFLRQAGLEWLWRLIQQPARWRRIINAVIIFPLLILFRKYFPEKMPENTNEDTE